MRQDGFDLEALEGATKAAMLRCGAIMLEHVLKEEDGSSLDRSCSCGGNFTKEKRVRKTIRTVVGNVALKRTYQRCNSCGDWRVPQDIVLDVANTGFSPGLRRMMAKTGAEVCFDKARDMIGDLAGLRVTDKEVERVAEGVGGDIACRDESSVSAVMADEIPVPKEAPSTLYIAADGTGVPVLRRETKGRKGKAADGIARTREVKLGAIFTQTTTDEKNTPVRDPLSTTYVGKIESCDDFGPRLYAEAFRRGCGKAERVVFIADGAPWLWNLADEHFGGATQIVDYYHAAEHIGNLAKLLYPEDKVGKKRWFKKLKKYLRKGDIEKVVSILSSLNVRGKKKEEVEKTTAYFEKNKNRMRYGKFRREGLFIGSGVVEAGCKSVIGARLKQSGMHWSVRGANDIITLRCCIESGYFEDYWESRRAA